MPKSREVLASIGLATALAVAGCGGAVPAKKAERRSKPSSRPNYTKEVQDLGAAVIKLNAEDPAQFTPENLNALNAGVSENTKDFGQLTIEAGYGESLTSNTVFGPLTLKLEQTFPSNSDGSQLPEPNGNSSINGFDIGFTLNIYQDSPGVWSSECVDNAPLATTVGEDSMQTAYFAGGYSVTDQKTALSILANEIAAVRDAVGIAGKHLDGSLAQPMVDARLGSFTN